MYSSLHIWQHSSWSHPPYYVFMLSGYLLLSSVNFIETVGTLEAIQGTFNVRLDMLADFPLDISVTRSASTFSLQLLPL